MCSSRAAALTPQLPCSSAGSKFRNILHTASPETTATDDDQNGKYYPHIARRDNRSWPHLPLEIPTLLLCRIEVASHIRDFVQASFSCAVDIGRTARRLSQYHRGWTARWHSFKIQWNVQGEGRRHAYSSCRSHARIGMGYNRLVSTATEHVIHQSQTRATLTHCYSAFERHAYTMLVRRLLRSNIVCCTCLNHITRIPNSCASTRSSSTNNNICNLFAFCMSQFSVFGLFAVQPSKSLLKVIPSRLSCTSFLIPRRCFDCRAALSIYLSLSLSLSLCLWHRNLLDVTKYNIAYSQTPTALEPAPSSCVWTLEKRNLKEIDQSEPKPARAPNQ